MQNFFNQSLKTAKIVTAVSNYFRELFDELLGTNSMIFGNQN